MGKGKTMMIYPWLTTMQYGREGDIEYYEFTGDWNDHGLKQDQIPDNPLITIGRERTLEDPLTQEQAIIRKDLFEKLSRDAKFIIRLILIGPNEKRFKNEKYSSYSKLKIREYLLQLGWKSNQINKTYMELREFVMALET